MNRMVDGGTGFILNPSCNMLRKGFNGRYRYQRLQLAGTLDIKIYRKDIYSHIQDALQYACLRMRAWK